MFKLYSKCLLFTFVLAGTLVAGPVSAQEVLFSEDFQSYEIGARPEGWTYVAGWFHTLEPQPTGDSVHDYGIPESADWAGTGNPECDWQVTTIKRFTMYDKTRGSDGVRAFWNTFVVDAEGNPIPDAPISGSMPKCDQLQWESPGEGAPVSRNRSGGSTAPWVEQPFPDFGCADPSTGEIDPDAKVLICDSDEYGGINMNSAIMTPAIDLQGANWVRIEFKYMTEQNQDEDKWCVFRIDDGPWQRVERQSMHRHGDDYAYFGDVSVVENTEGGSTIQLMWNEQGHFSWYWCVDDVVVKGYDSMPTDGPAQPQGLAPTGVVDPGEDVTLFAGSYNGSAPHAFSQWQIRDENGTYGTIEDYSTNSYSELFPVIDTGIQPNHYADGAVVGREDGTWGSPIVLGRPNPAAQLRVPIGEAGDLTQQVIPADVLRPGVTYKWRVRYWDNNFVASPWSDEQSLTVRAIPGNTVYTEDFDGIEDPDGTDPWENRPENWVGDFIPAQWDVSSLGVAQLLGHNLSETFNALSFAPDDPNYDYPSKMMEPDARGHHGRFRGNVMVFDSGTGTVACTAPIDNSGSDQPLYLLCDVQVRSGNDAVAFAVDVIEGDDPYGESIEEVYTWQNVSADFSDSFMGGRTNSVVYTISPVIVSEAAAGKTVRFRFWGSEQDGGDEYVILDNIQVIQYDEAAPVQGWELY